MLEMLKLILAQKPSCVYEGVLSRSKESRTDGRLGRVCDAESTTIPGSIVAFLTVCGLIGGSIDMSDVWS